MSYSFNHKRLAVCTIHTRALFLTVLGTGDGGCYAPVAKVVPCGFNRANLTVCTIRTCTLFLTVFGASGRCGYAPIAKRMDSRCINRACLAIRAIRARPYIIAVFYTGRRFAFCPFAEDVHTFVGRFVALATRALVGRRACVVIGRSTRIRTGCHARSCIGCISRIVWRSTRVIVGCATCSAVSGCRCALVVFFAAVLFAARTKRASKSEKQGDQREPSCVFLHFLFSSLKIKSAQPKLRTEKRIAPLLQHNFVFLKGRRKRGMRFYPCKTSTFS